MDRIYLDRNGHVWYATLNENGQSSNQRLFLSDAEEKNFLEFLGDAPTNYSIDYLQKLYGEFKRAYK
jgi:hypothetical protein